MARPTIRDLARAADVSVSTVNRVLNGSGSVRRGTMERVLGAAEEIGFYGIGSIQNRVAAGRPVHRLGVVLLQRNRSFYQAIARHFEAAAASFADAAVDLRIEFLDDLSPENVSAKLLEIGEESDCIAVVTAEHPIVTDAIERLFNKGVPVFGLISPLSARFNVHYVGLDNWKVGRTSAWAFDKICKAPGKIGILVGNHRYRNQDLNESGFRSYFREYCPEFTLLEPLSTFESSAVAREMTEQLLKDHPDLAGLYISGGGITGALAAIRESERAGNLVTVGYELFETTKAALLDDILTFVISHPFERLAQETISSMIRAKLAGPDAGSQTVLLDFEIHTRENI